MRCFEASCYMPHFCLGQGVWSNWKWWGISQGIEFLSWTKNTVFLGHSWWNWYCWFRARCEDETNEFTIFKIQSLKWLFVTLREMLTSMCTVRMHGCQCRLALIHTSVICCHYRFGFLLTDNVAICLCLLCLVYVSSLLFCIRTCIAEAARDDRYTNKLSS